jgi:ABC-2 type transport system permease protein
MAAELLKLRALPTPRVTLLVSLGFVAIAFLATLLSGADKTSTYEDGATSAAALGAGLGSIVIGVWIVGVEYGEETLRRVLTSDPRRLTLLVSKLAVGLAAVVALTIVTWVAAIALLSLSASLNGVSLPADEVMGDAVAALFVNSIYAVVGAGVALITRSMAGGMTVMLALLFAVEVIVAAIPAINDVSLARATSEIAGAISGDEEEAELARGLLVTLAWVVVVTGAGVLRFLEEDVE